MTCKNLAGTEDLQSIALADFPEGNHTFTAFLRGRNGSSGAGELADVSNEELRTFAVEVPYGSGLRAVYENIGNDQEDGADEAAEGVGMRGDDQQNSDEAEGAGRSMGVVEWAIGLHFSHDAHLTVLHFGIPLLVLELERLTERRYFTGFYVGADERERVVNAWEAAGEAAREAALGAMVEVSKRSASTSVGGGGGGGDFQFDVGCFNLVYDGGFAGEGPHDAMFRDALAIAKSALR